VQTCNPPDLFWPIGVFFRVINGSSFVFDHHDLCPELFLSRFPDGNRFVYRALRFLERCTARAADHVIATNDSYRRIVLERDGVSPTSVTVVRTGPDLATLGRSTTQPDVRPTKPHVAAYLGVMGPQDGVDLVLEVADQVVHRLGRHDIGFTLIGSGDSYDDLVALSGRLGLTDYVTFTGRIPDADVAAILSTADVGISPDPKNPLNDVSTMNKTMEYMAFELPVVAFDLRETRMRHLTTWKSLRSCSLTWSTTNPDGDRWGVQAGLESKTSSHGSIKLLATSASTRSLRGVRHNPSP
jgi:glycosyltransferase involved in cell wall biosynthesis